MYRIRFHDRGGQGIKTASRILGNAFFSEGYEVQDAPVYATERRGAPIQERGAITHPDQVVVADESLVPVPVANVLQSVTPHTVLLINFTHPKIAQVSVFGIPDEFHGEEVMAWLQLHAGQTASEDEIKAFCKGKMAHFKIPKYVWFVDEFPMTVTGKLQKIRMRELALEKMRASGAMRAGAPA